MRRRTAAETRAWLNEIERRAASDEPGDDTVQRWRRMSPEARALVWHCHRIQVIEETLGLRCREPSCPDYGDADFGEGTCPAEHARSESSLGWPLDDLTSEWHRGTTRLSLTAEGYRRGSDVGWPTPRSPR